jgi:hypothetical protein
MAAALTWRMVDPGLYMAHPSYGHWSIELRRGRWYVGLRLLGKGMHEEQDFGSEPTRSKAQAAVAKAHQAISKLD